MREFSYDSDLIGGSLLVREARVIADLLLSKADDAEWKRAIHTENRLQKRSPATAIRQASALRKRLERLDEPFWRALRDGDDELATQVAFVAALERNLLLVEFVETVLKDAFILRAEKLAQYQWMDFLEDRAHRDPTIADWTESSKKKMGQVAFRILAEAGLLQSTRSLRLQNVLVRPEVNVLLEDSRRYRIKACLNVSSTNPA
jgi:bacteriophage exclusion system BrxA-like protein